VEERERAHGKKDGTRVSKNESEMRLMMRIFWDLGRDDEG